MAYDIKQSSTQADLWFFLVESSDHITGLTGASPTVTLLKNGGSSFASPAGSVSEIGNGWYKVAANATDTNTLGPLALHATASSADPYDNIVANIVAYDPQDAVHLGLSALPNTACTSNASLITSGSGTDQITVSGGVASADAKKINAVSTSSVTTVNANVGTTQPVNFTGTAGSALVKTDMVDIAGSAVSASTAQLGVNVVNFGGSAGTFASGKPSVMLASTDVSGNVAADLQTIKTQTVTCAGGVTVPAATLASTTNITAASGCALTGDLTSTMKTSVEDAVWDATASSHTTTGTTGKELSSAASAGDPWATPIPGSYTSGEAGYILGNNLDAAISSRLAAADISLSTGAVTVGTNNDKTGYALTQSFPTNFASMAIDSTGRVNAFVIGILTSVFTEGATGRIAAAFKQFFNVASPTSTMNEITLVDTTTNSTNSASNGDFTSTMKTSLNAATPAVTVSDKTGFSLSSAGVQAIWDALTSALTTVGSVGKLLVTNVDAAVSSRMATYTQPTGFLSATFPSGTVANTTNITAASGCALTSAYDAAKTAAQAGDAMTLTNGGIDSIFKRDVSAITGEAARSLLNAIRILRNKFSTSGTTLTVTKEDDTTTAWTSTLTTDDTALPITGSDPS